MSRLDELEKLAALKEEGILDQKEYRAKKAEIMSRDISSFESASELVMDNSSSVVYPEVPNEEMPYLNQGYIHRIKEPERYGGVTRTVFRAVEILTFFLWPICLVIGFVWSMSSSRVRAIQGKREIVNSLFMAGLHFFVGIIIGYLGG